MLIAYTNFTYLRISETLIKDLSELSARFIYLFAYFGT